MNDTAISTLLREVHQSLDEGKSTFVEITLDDTYPIEKRSIRNFFQPQTSQARAQSLARPFGKVIQYDNRSRTYIIQIFKAGVPNGGIERKKIS